MRVDADLKAAFEDTLRGIGVDPTCAMMSFAFQTVLERASPSTPSTPASRRAAGPR